MVTNIEATVPYDTVAHFDRIAVRIEQTINPLIEQLIERKTILLQEVAQLREDFHNKENTRLTAIHELDKTQQQLGQMSLRSNIAIPVHEQAGLLYQQAKQQLSTPTPLPNLRFFCPSLTHLQRQIKQFGKIVQLDATQKRQPILTTGKNGEGEKKLHAKGLSLDEANKKVYIADCYNSRVQVLSFEGDFLSQFGKKVVSKPWGISVTKDHVYVTDYHRDMLFLFCKNSHQVLNRVGGKGSNEEQLFGPMGISVDCNGDVFVADCINNRVSVFTKLFKHKQTIGQGSLYYPRDVKLTKDKVVVLDESNYCVHLFSRRGDVLISCVSQGRGQACLVNIPFFFSLDSDENIIISDYGHHDIKILTNSGELLHTIGRKGNEEGEFIGPLGMALSDSDIIFVYSDNPNHSLQQF